MEERFIAITKILIPFTTNAYIRQQISSEVLHYNPNSSRLLHQIFFLFCHCFSFSKSFSDTKFAPDSEIIILSFIIPILYQSIHCFYNIFMYVSSFTSVTSYHIFHHKIYLQLSWFLFIPNSCGCSTKIFSSYFVVNIFMENRKWF